MAMAAPRGRPTTTRLRDRLSEQLQAVYALESAALQMSDAVLAGARYGDSDGARSTDALPSRSVEVLRAYREVTDRHASLLGARLEELGRTPSVRPAPGAGAAAALAATDLGGRDFVAAVRDASVLVQVSITSLELVERLARAADDATTVDLARGCRAGEEEIAAKIRDELLETTVILRETTTASRLRDGLSDQLQAVYALESAALQMSDAVLAAARYRRADAPHRSTDALLSKSIDMFRAELLDVFRAYREVTDRHASLLRARLEELGRTPSVRPAPGAGAAAALAATDLGGRDFVAAVRDASVLVQVSITSLELVERLARAADDATTVDLARGCRAGEEEIAAKIRDAFKHVLSLTLLAQRMRPSRRASGPGLTSEAGAAVDEPVLGLA